MCRANQQTLVRWMVIVSLGMRASVDAAQDPAQHEHMPTARAWHFMQDAIVFGNFNHQGGDRGGDEFVAPNWWMGIASRGTSHGQLTLTGMLSLDAATVEKKGYREIFQVGEAFDGHPLVDRQHPHDLFMQLAAIWRVPLTASTALTFAGAPVGEPALGPVAFMHRASAADNPTAPLGHHTFDSTHISFGVITAALDHRAWTVEGSVFNGREPDANRWDFDFGALDSFSGRVWFRPTAEWEFQASTGHLESPEELEPGDIDRSTASLSWTRRTGIHVSSLTVGYGRNDTDHGTRNAIFAEGARHVGLSTFYGRFEGLQVETFVLETRRVSQQFGAAVTPLPACPALVSCADLDRRDTVLAFTIGAVRDVLRARGFEGGFGGDVTFYAVPDRLESAYGAHPISIHLFFRLRPPAGSMGRMWNMRMSQPMAHH